MTDRKKPGLAFWATVVVVIALVAYPLSFGPACWMRTRFRDSAVWDATDVFYSPILALWSQTYPDWCGRGISWYANLGTAPQSGVGPAKSSRGYSIGYYSGL